ncbi:WD40-repeat-containing domain protein [Mycena maculata]|uniref:WD40-repeat-containing domain protein n=1 Tax=Mycena maculata TaxID=230809 RepID=A0AAD7NNY0_9AGAR|nr:WD40-repeat-containing domain protein [Mycena maculata]
MTSTSTPPTFRISKALLGHSDSINTIGFSPNGKQIASGGEDGVLFIYNTKTFKEEKKYTTMSPIRAIAWHVDVDQNKHNIVVEYTVQGPIHCMSFDKKGKLIAVGYNNECLLARKSAISSWTDERYMTRPENVGGSPDITCAVNFHATEKIMLATYLHAGIRAYNTENSALLWRLNVQGLCGDSALSPTSRILAATVMHDGVRWYDVSERILKHTTSLPLENKKDLPLPIIFISPNTVVVGSDNGKAYFHNAQGTHILVTGTSEAYEGSKLTVWVATDEKKSLFTSLPWRRLGLGAIAVMVAIAGVLVAGDTDKIQEAFKSKLASRSEASDPVVQSQVPTQFHTVTRVITRHPGPSFLPVVQGPDLEPRRHRFEKPRAHAPQVKDKQVKMTYLRSPSDEQPVDLGRRATWIENIFWDNIKDLSVQENISDEDHQELVGIIKVAMEAGVEDTSAILNMVLREKHPSIVNAVVPRVVAFLRDVRGPGSFDSASHSNPSHPSRRNPESASVGGMASYRHPSGRNPESASDERVASLRQDPSSQKMPPPPAGTSTVTPPSSSSVAQVQKHSVDGVIVTATSQAFKSVSGSNGSFTWYRTESQSEIEKPLTVSPTNPGDLFLHFNTVQKNYLVWLCNGARVWEDISDIWRDKTLLVHPTFSDRVLKIRQNDSPNWILKTSLYNSMRICRDLVTRCDCLVNCQHKYPEITVGTRANHRQLGEVRVLDSGLDSEVDSDQESNGESIQLCRFRLSLEEPP